MDQEDLSKCYFVPFSAMENTIELLDKSIKMNEYYLCKRNLYQLQNHKLDSTVRKDKDPGRNIYQFALSRAIYSHDWDKILYLLKKSPIVYHYSNKKSLLQDKLNVYIRAVILLLMNHPSAKAKGLLHEYMHMVCTCRTDNEKKALMRAILTLPEKITLKVDTCNRKRYDFYYNDE